MKYIVVHNSLVIECPKCGELGVLWAHKRNTFGDLKFRIVHDRHNWKCCSVYDDDDCYKELIELYNKVKK